MPLWIAHRGGAPENTLEAFASARDDLWVDGAECDVRFTRDHVPVVYHDVSLSRIHGQDLLIHETNAAELHTLFSIPKLEELFQLWQPSSKLLILEVKGAPHAEDTETLFKLCRSPTAPSNLVIASFDEVFLQKWPGSEPRMILCCNRFTAPCWESYLEYVGLSEEMATPDWIEAIRAHHSPGLPPPRVFVFTVNDPATCGHLCGTVHCDGVISDFVATIRTDTKNDQVSQGDILNQKAQKTKRCHLNL